MFLFVFWIIDFRVSANFSYSQKCSLISKRLRTAGPVWRRSKNSCTRVISIRGESICQAILPRGKTLTRHFSKVMIDWFSVGGYKWISILLATRLRGTRAESRKNGYPRAVGRRSIRGSRSTMNERDSGDYVRVSSLSKSLNELRHSRVQLCGVSKTTIPGSVENIVFFFFFLRTQRLDKTGVSSNERNKRVNLVLGTSRVNSKFTIFVAFRHVSSANPIASLRSIQTFLRN